MTIHVSLSPEMEDFIMGKVASGLYGTATEVIHDAIRRMQAEERCLAAWRAAVREGDVQLDRGEGVTYSRETLEAISKNAIKSMRSGQRTDRDALP